MMIRGLKKYLTCILISLTISTYHLFHNNGAADKVIYTYREKAEAPKNESSSRKKIFFVETSERSRLSIRQACAIESTALHNPSSHILVLVNGGVRRNLLLDALVSKRKVDFQAMDLEDNFRGTPLENFHKSLAWLNSPFKVNHLSDALRFTLLWKHGGIYMDLDVVVQRPLDSFRNALVYESKNNVACGMMFFQRQSPFLKRCLLELKYNYKANNWGANGPLLVTRQLAKVCRRGRRKKACEVTVLPKETMLPIHFRDWRHYFDPSRAKTVLGKVNSSYVVHLWNKFSAKQRVQVGSGCAYDEIAKIHCPLSYSFAQVAGHF